MKLEEFNYLHQTSSCLSKKGNGLNVSLQTRVRRRVSKYVPVTFFFLSERLVIEGFRTGVCNGLFLSGSNRSLNFRT